MGGQAGDLGVPYERHPASSARRQLETLRSARAMETRV